MDKEIEELELLSLVNKISQEIFNFTGSADQDLAKFVIAVSRQSDRIIILDSYHADAGS